VFGDIGTSPLYVVRAVFTVHGGAVPLTDASIYGVISLVVWMLLLIVSFKYVILVLRANSPTWKTSTSCAGLPERSGRHDVP
ncbi:KUP/HAK/KT family potassium transporter, partial [Actinotignum timonense]|nr:KUP/HAK/KT family potassium transporter [Actinotignum timonense]